MDDLLKSLRDSRERFIFQGGSEFALKIAAQIEQTHEARMSARRNHDDGMEEAAQIVEERGRKIGGAVNPTITAKAIRQKKHEKTS